MLRIGTKGKMHRSHNPPPPPPSPQLSFKTTKHVTFSNAHCTPEQGQASVSLYQEDEAEIHVYVRERGLISLGILYYSQ